MKTKVEIKDCRTCRNLIERYSVEDDIRVLVCDKNKNCYLDLNCDCYEKLGD